MISVIDLQFMGLPKSIACFPVKTSAGWVLVETGPHSCFQTLCQELELLGIDWKEIKHVLITHIHLDHAGAAWAFAEQGAKIYVHPLGYKHLQDPSKLMDSAKRIYQDLMDSLWGKMEAITPDQLVAIEHGQNIQIGDSVFTAWHTPGHAIHHIAWQLEDNLFCGDVGGVKMDHGCVVPPCPPPDIHIEDWKKSIRMLKSTQAQNLYLAHFGLHPALGHWESLEMVLDDWSLWIKSYFDQEIQIGEVTSIFAEKVENQLKKAGMNEEQIARYEVANPSYMNVTGLYRYWKIKSQVK